MALSLVVAGPGRVAVADPEMRLLGRKNEKGPAIEAKAE
jgi:hypothetical protein